MDTQFKKDIVIKMVNTQYLPIYAKLGYDTSIFPVYVCSYLILFF